MTSYAWKYRIDKKLRHNKGWQFSLSKVVHRSRSSIMPEPRLLAIIYETTWAESMSTVLKSLLSADNWPSPENLSAWFKPWCNRKRLRPNTTKNQWLLVLLWKDRFGNKYYALEKRLHRVNQEILASTTWKAFALFTILNRATSEPPK